MNEISFKLPLNGGNSTQGERKIENVLQEVTKQLNIFYNRETKIGMFEGKRRRADFSFNYNNRTFLIEYDGIQHSQPIDKFGGTQKLKEIQKRDHWENNVFCPSNNVCLIRYKVFKGFSHEKLLNFITPERILSDIKKASKCKYVQNGISYGRKRIRIAADLDQTVFDWISAHEKRFGCSLSTMKDEAITEQVNTLKNDREFWVGLELLEKPDFVPELYCTKRVNKKSFTKVSLKKHGLPDRPICQISSQKANKASYIRKKCDVLIDDSWFNVKQCLDAGFPALLITREHNKHIKTPYRVNHLKYQEIAKKYYELF